MPRLHSLSPSCCRQHFKREDVQHRQLSVLQCMGTARARPYLEVLSITTQMPLQIIPENRAGIQISADSEAECRDAVSLLAFTLPLPVMHCSSSRFSSSSLLSALQRELPFYRKMLTGLWL